MKKFILSLGLLLLPLIFVFGCATQSFKEPLTTSSYSFSEKIHVIKTNIGNKAYIDWSLFSFSCSDIFPSIVFVKVHDPRMVKELTYKVDGKFLKTNSLGNNGFSMTTKNFFKLANGKSVISILGYR